MRDKEIMSYMNPEFTDGAWREMEKILDREMPVKRDRKRLVIWFRMAAGLLLLLSIGWFLFPANAGQTEATIANLPSINTDIQKKSSDNSLIPTTHTAHISNETTNTHSTLKKSLISPNSRNQNADVTTVELPKQKVSANQSPKPNEPVIASISETDPVIKSTESDSGEKTVESPAYSSYIVKTVNTIPLMVDETSEQEPSNFPEPTKVKKRLLRKSDFLVYANGQSETLSSLNGFEAGIALGRNLGESRFEVSIGAGFQSEIRELVFETNSFLNTPYSDSSTPASQVVINPEVYNNFGSANDPVTGMPTNDFTGSLAAAGSSYLNVQLNYLALPVNLRYRMTPRLGIFGGITPSVFLFGSITPKDDYAAIGNLQDDAEVAANFASGSQDSYPIANNRFFYFTSKPLDPAAINRFKFPVQIGLDYHITRKFVMTLDYQHTPFTITDKSYVRTNTGRIRLGGQFKF